MAGFMNSRKKFFFLLLLIILNCTSYIPPKYDLGSYQKKYHSFDIEVYLKEEIENGKVKITGIIKNIYVYDMINFEITARVLVGDRKIKEKTYYFFPEVLKPNEYYIFSIELEEIPENGRISYFYRYNTNYDEDFSLQYGSF